ncbi:MAG: hypothetical protein EBQ99_04370 [Planctomycetes bacterium]|nr:hypothetical protein [Planctomycetota bacterium]
MNVPAMYGLVAQGVIVAALVRALRLSLGRASAAPRAAELWLPLLLVLLAPVEGVSLAGHLRGLWGDPSVVSLGALLLFLRRPAALPAWPHRYTCALLTLLVTLPLHFTLFLPMPMVTWDLYALGLEPWPVLAAVAMAAIMLRHRAGGPWTALVGMALLAYALGVMESDNLWDYLVDPVLLLAIAFAGFTGIWTSLHR